MKHLLQTLGSILFSLLLSQSSNAQDVLAGLTSNGGAEGGGTAFTIKTNGTAFSAIKTFASWGSTMTSALTKGADGNLYGVAYEGGIYGTGTIFRVTTTGAVTVLKNLNIAVDGGYPKGALLLAKDGYFYGTVSAGTPNNGGGVFKISSAGVYTLIKSFSINTEGGKPSGKLIQATDGNLYGINYSGGSKAYGTIFKLTTAGACTVLRTFTYATDGGNSYGGLIQAKDGNFYGMTYWGGTKQFGTIFRITAAGVYTVLRNLDSKTDGAYPTGDLLEGKDGLLYGLAASGGTYGNGTVFKITTAGVFTILKSLNAGAEGGNPAGSLIQATDGNFYGLTSNISGGYAGSVIKMTTAGVVTAIKKFTYATEGSRPAGSLMQHTDGNLYGFTKEGGLNLNGTVFKISTAGAFSVISHFCGSTQGRVPYENLATGKDSAYYGVTNTGGQYNFGTIFKICGGTTTVLKHFNKATDGGNPAGGLLRASDGNFYGMTQYGGTNGSGTIYKITPAGVYTVLRHLKSSTDGGTPLGNLIQGTDGFLYGMASAGGASNAGTIFKISTAGAFTLLRSLVTATDGSAPEGTLVQGKDGNFYGIATKCFFKITAAGAFTPLVTLNTSTQGYAPSGAPVQAADGNFYVLNSSGGSYSGGTIIKITTAGAVTVLRHLNSAADGNYPKGSLVLASDGFFYGVNSQGGTNKAGTLFKISTAGAFSIVRHFNLITDGGAPTGGLILAPKNNLVATPQSNIAATAGVAKAIVLAGTGSSTLNYTITSQPKHGTITGSGKNWTYTPTAGYVGKDSIAFTVSVACMASAPATVSFNVAAKTLAANAELVEDSKLYPASSLYPNPVDSRCVITIPEYIEKASTTVYDIKGSLIMADKHRISGTSQLELDASSLKTGQYIVRVVTAKNVYTFKFIKK